MLLESDLGNLGQENPRILRNLEKKILFFIWEISKQKNTILEKKTFFYLENFTQKKLENSKFKKFNKKKETFFWEISPKKSTFFFKIVFFFFCEISQIKNVFFFSKLRKILTPDSPDQTKGVLIATLRDQPPLCLQKWRSMAIQSKVAIDRRLPQSSLLLRSIRGME